MKTNFRIEVYPRRLGDYGCLVVPDNYFRGGERIEEDYQQRCEEMIADMKRHVDNFGSAEVVWDEEE